MNDEIKSPEYLLNEEKYKDMKKEMMKTSIDEYITIRCADLTDDEKRALVFQKVEIKSDGITPVGKILGYDDNGLTFRVYQTGMNRFCKEVRIKNPDYQPPVKSVFDRCQYGTILSNRFNEKVYLVILKRLTPKQLHFSDGSHEHSGIIDSNFDIISGGKE